MMSEIYTYILPLISHFLLALANPVWAMFAYIHVGVTEFAILKCESL